MFALPSSHGRSFYNQSFCNRQDKFFLHFIAWRLTAVSFVAAVVTIAVAIAPQLFRHARVIRAGHLLHSAFCCKHNINYFMYGESRQNEIKIQKTSKGRVGQTELLHSQIQYVCPRFKSAHRSSLRKNIVIMFFNTISKKSSQ